MTTVKVWVEFDDNVEGYDGVIVGGHVHIRSPQSDKGFMACPIGTGMGEAEKCVAMGQGFVTAIYDEWGMDAWVDLDPAFEVEVRAAFNA